MDIAEFLTARYGEDEALAKAATPGPWMALDGGVQSLGADEQWPVSETESALDREDRLHIARHDPARVLADIAAKQQMLGLIDPMRNLERSWERQHGGDWQSRGSGLLLKLLAAPYADHPDYDPAWAVSE